MQYLVHILNALNIYYSLGVHKFVGRSEETIVDFLSPVSKSYIRSFFYKELIWACI